MTSNSLVSISNLLYLTEIYGTKNDVKFVPEKTKLVKFALSSSIDDDEETSFLKLYDKSIPFTSMADHLGVIRTSSASNMANITKRISAHRGKLFSHLPSGLALRHNASRIVLKD